MPRPKGAGSHPRLGRALESLISEVERDCSDEEIGALMRKIQRLTDRSIKKAFKKTGLVQVGPVIPPECVIGTQTAATAAKALETLEVIKGRRIERLSKITALFEALNPPDEEERGEHVFRIDLSSTERPKESGEDEKPDP